MKNVLITGAARGLGRELARQFNTRGHRLWLVVRSEDSRTDLLAQIPQAQILVCDVTDANYSKTLAHWLGTTAVDILINNAGTGSKGPSVDTADIEQIRRVFETNCLGSFATVKGAVEALRRADQAMLVNISSRRGSMSMQAERSAKGSGCSYSYRISKAALNMLTLCLADDLEDDGIKVAAIHPGRLKTKMASKDASMTAEESAVKIYQLLLNDDVPHRSLYSVESGLLDW